MQNSRCSKCGQEYASDVPCPDCGRDSVNESGKKNWVKPSPPPEVANWVLEPVPPEMREEFLRTFNEEEFLAEAREALATGGADIDALIAEIQRKVDANV